VGTAAEAIFSSLVEILAITIEKEVNRGGRRGSDVDREHRNMSYMQEKQPIWGVRVVL
jgi:hypothetical protein